MRAVFVHFEPSVLEDVRRQISGDFDRDDLVVRAVHDELDAKSDRIQSALEYAKRNLHTPLSVEQLADAAHLSPRQFSRAFHAETGQSPAKAVENLRVEAARVMMEQGRHPIDIVANETGFADRERMRRAFLRAYGQPPQTMPRNARVERPAVVASAGIG